MASDISVGADCGPSLLLNIVAYAKTLEIYDETQQKPQRTLCDDIVAELQRRQVNEIPTDYQLKGNGIAEGAVPKQSTQVPQTLILIRYLFFPEPSRQPAINFVAIDHTEGVPQDDDKFKVGRIKVYWRGYPTPTWEPAINVLEIDHAESLPDGRMKVYWRDYPSNPTLESRDQVEKKQKAKADAEAREAKDKADAEARERADAEARERVAKEETEGKAKADAATRAKEAARAAEREAAEREAAEREAAEREAKEREAAEREAKAKADRAVVQAKEESEAKAKTDAATRAREAAAEKEAKEKADAAAVQAKEEAKVREDAAVEAAAAKAKKAREEEKVVQARKKTRLVGQSMTGAARAKPTPFESIMSSIAPPTSSTSAATTSTKKTAEPTTVAVFKPPFVGQTGTDRTHIDASVDPCLVGAVNRRCLMRKDSCARYVVDSIDTVEYGEPQRKEVGSGTFGAVYPTDKNFAIKCFTKQPKIAGEIYANDLREMVLLRNLIHVNIVQVLQVAIIKAAPKLPQCSMAMVMPLYQGTLRDLRKTDITRNVNLRATLMYQLLRGVAFIHSRGVWHRDIKPHNVLWNPETNQVALADFGIAQGLVIDNNRYYSKVVTSHYRPPEIFLKSPRYSSAVDVWSVGATWLDLLDWLVFRPPQHLENDYNVLRNIFTTFGYPSESLFPQAMQLPGWSAFQQEEKKRRPDKSRSMYRELLQARKIGDQEYNLLQSMLNIDPSKRISAQHALTFGFFNAVRAQVSDAFPANPLPPEPLSTCGSVLLAMESAPVGNYLRQNSDKKLVIREMFQWLLMINRDKNWSHRQSIWFSAIAFFHRFAVETLKIETLDMFLQKLYLAGLACYTIASKLDADADTSVEITAVAGAPIVSLKTQQAVSAEDFVLMQRSVYRTLDMDFDRPHAMTFVERVGRVLDDNVYARILQQLEEQMLSPDLGFTKRASQLVVDAIQAEHKRTPCMEQFKRVFPELFQ